MEPNNQKYIHYKYLIPRISHAVSELGIPFSEDDIAEWAAECEVDYIQDVRAMIPYCRVPVPVTAGVAKLPCNVFRIRDVYYGGSRVDFYNDGSFLRFSESFTAPYVFMNFTGLPIGEDGIPLILKGHEQAIVAFCVWKMVYPFWIAGKMNPNIYLEIKDNVDIQVQASKNGFRHIDRGTLNQMTAIFGNIIPKIAGLELYHEAFADNGVGAINSEFWNW